MREGKPIEVAVIGGGCASIAAAFELTRPEHRGKYHVTVYQQGWRLGGKAASGRGPADRIEEHGLHIWMGCYDNAFRLMRDCYAELGRNPGQYRFADWRDAFMPDPVNGVADRSPNGEWKHWTATFPPAPGTPGDPVNARERFNLARYLVQGAALIRTLLWSAQKAGRGETRTVGSEEDASRTRSRIPSPEKLFESVGQVLKYGQLASMSALIQAVELLELVLGALPSFPQGLVLRLIDAISSNTRDQLERLIETDDGLRRIWEVVDMMLAILRGSVRFGLATHPAGLDAINDYDFLEWLKLNGASERSLDSGFARALHDLFFAYEDGDPGRPRRAAGDALRSTLRMYLTYRGAFYWKLRAGMGDVVFAPFYEVLKRRGVTFEFFHRLENVRLADPATLAVGERPYVEALEIDVQAEVEGGGEYRPLVDVRGLPCWPAAPVYGQLVEGQDLKSDKRDFESHWDRTKVFTKTLTVGEDFDFVVLGVGIGAVPFVAREIVARDPRWRAMVERVKTVATQAIQIWMSRDMEELGWSDPPINLSGFVQPFAAFADMRQLIPEESWRCSPRTIAYFCSALPTPAGVPERSWADYPAEQRELVRANAVRFLSRDVGKLWPAWVRDGDFRWELLVDPKEPEPPSESARYDESRFDSQFWTANVNPSDRYTLSLPGSAKYRISPLDNTYDNLTIAGDWTDCGYNEGCVESAVMSGRLAAHAISSSPALEEIIGFDMP